MKTFKQHLDEYSIVSPKDFFDTDDLEDYIKKIDSKLSKFKKVNTPVSDLFDVMYLKTGVYHDYALLDKKTGKTVGLFGLDEKPPKQDTSKIVKPGVGIVVPHLMLNKEYQNKGVGKRIYRSFLETGKFVYATDEHTRSAKSLWDSLEKLPTMKSVMYQNYRYIGKKESFV